MRFLQSHAVLARQSSFLRQLERQLLFLPWLIVRVLSQTGRGVFLYEGYNPRHLTPLRQSERYVRVRTHSAPDTILVMRIAHMDAKYCAHINYPN